MRTPTNRDEAEDATLNVWDQVLARLRTQVDGEEFRRWFVGTSYASDAGDVVTVWVLTEPVRRHLMLFYYDAICRVLRTLGRDDVHIRFVVTGHAEDDE